MNQDVEDKSIVQSRYVYLKPTDETLNKSSLITEFCLSLHSYVPR